MQWARKLLPVVLLAVSVCAAQTSIGAAPPQPASQAVPAQAQPAPPPVPPVTLISKSVTFIRLTCRDGVQQFDVRGTGFFVYYPDAGLGKNAGFVYLVTNRHVAECWNESGKPMQVENISITMNRKQPIGDTLAQQGFLNPYGNVSWIFPEDDSIDLAILPFAPDESTFDYIPIPISIFLPDDLLKKQQITEGDQVIFAGFFYQFPGSKQMEPIIRQGNIAMLPVEKFPFLNTSEKVYLADLHAFGGNSGSPVFVNVDGFHNGTLTLGVDYRLLGIINAEVTEDTNFNLILTTTFQGKMKENSGISTIVPADELRALLDDPRLQRLREQAVKAAEGPHQ